ncbi:MAG: hypothetical protein LDL33_02805 [Desulfomonile sp.]|nr:hypothetical protein [Desulfomonile sp.]
MKKFRAFCAVLAVALLFVAAAPSFAAYVWDGHKYYRIYYDDSSQYTYVTRVQPYLTEAFWAAYRVLGKRGYIGVIDIYFYYENSQWAGYTPLGANAMYLNTKYLSNYTGQSIGSIISHETSHILFGHWTKGDLWAANFTNMWYYYSFLTESLAYFTGSVAYAYGSKYSAATVKSYLKYYAAQTGSVISWWGTGYIYNNSSRYSASLFNQTWWQFHAQGYYLTGGATTVGNASLVRLIDVLRYYASSPGLYLRSSSYNIARNYFENAFRVSYGYIANAAWNYAPYYNTNYLYGKWYQLWYL